MDSINIKLREDGAVFIIEEYGAVIKEKRINPDSLINLIKNSIYNEVTDSYGSNLPKNCIYYGVTERRSGLPSQTVVIEREKCIRPYNHFGLVEMVGYPKLLFIYKVTGNQIVSSSVVAATDEFITDSSPVYHFPYANVFIDGRICMGTYHYPEIKSLTDLTFLPEDFYLIEHTHEKNATGEVIRDILDQVQEKPFDDGLLKFYKTFKRKRQKFNT
jgi:hypothetical protein